MEMFDVSWNTALAVYGERRVCETQFLDPNRRFVVYRTDSVFKVLFSINDQGTIEHDCEEHLFSRFTRHNFRI